MVQAITRTATEYIWIPSEDETDTYNFIKRKHPKLWFKVEYHVGGYFVYFKFKNKTIARRIQRELVKEGYFKFLELGG